MKFEDTKLAWVLTFLNVFQQQKRGIRANLDDAFNFEELQSIKSRSRFVEEGLPSISHASKEFFLRSDKYFKKSGAGDQLILRDLVSFTQPTTMGQLDLSSPEFSFTAWVRTNNVSYLFFLVMMKNFYVS